MSHGRLFIDPEQPHVLRMAGEVDHAVVAPAREVMSVADLAGVDVVDMAEATFLDSAVVALIANLVVNRGTDAELLAVRQVPDLALAVLEISGLLPALKIVD